MKTIALLIMMATVAFLSSCKDEGEKSPADLQKICDSLPTGKSYIKIIVRQSDYSHDCTFQEVNTKDLPNLKYKKYEVVCQK